MSFHKVILRRDYTAILKRSARAMAFFIAKDITRCVKRELVYNTILEADDLDKVTGLRCFATKCYHGGGYQDLLERLE